MTGVVLDKFFLIEIQNIGVLEPLPINIDHSEGGHHGLLTVFLVFSCLVLLGIGIYFIRKKIRSKYEKTLINYEMERL